MGRLEILQHLKPKIRDFELRNKIEGTTLLICGMLIYVLDTKVNICLPFSLHYS